MATDWQAIKLEYINSPLSLKEIAEKHDLKDATVRQRAHREDCDDSSRIFYVYELIDPRNGKVFYVGKGSGDRLNDHERDAIRGKVINKKKTNCIKEIHAEGLRVISHIVSFYSDEQDALDAEAELIEQLPGLTNICAKGSPSVSNIEFIKRMIRKIRSNALIDLKSVRQEVIDIGNEYLIFADLLEKKLAEIQR